MVGRDRRRIAGEERRAGRLAVEEREQVHAWSSRARTSAIISTVSGSSGAAALRSSTHSARSG